MADTAKKRPATINHWRLERQFDRVVVIGYDRDDRRLTQVVDWWANGKFGTPEGCYNEGPALTDLSSGSRISYQADRIIGLGRFPKQGGEPMPSRQYPPALRGLNL